MPNPNSHRGAAYTFRRATRHPGRVSIAIVAVVLGVLVLNQAITGKGPDLSPSLSIRHIWQAPIMGGFLCLGGTVWLITLGWWIRSIAILRGLQRSSTVLCGLGYFWMFVVIFLSHPDRIPGWITVLAMMLGCFGATVDSFLQEREDRMTTKNADRIRRALGR